MGTDIFFSASLPTDSTQPPTLCSSTAAGTWLAGGIWLIIIVIRIITSDEEDRAAARVQCGWCYKDTHLPSKFYWLMMARQPVKSQLGPAPINLQYQRSFSSWIPSPELFLWSSSSFGIGASNYLVIIIFSNGPTVLYWFAIWTREDLSSISECQFHGTVEIDK